MATVAQKGLVSAPFRGMHRLLLRRDTHYLLLTKFQGRTKPGTTGRVDFHLSRWIEEIMATQKLAKLASVSALVIGATVGMITPSFADICDLPVSSLSRAQLLTVLQNGCQEVPHGQKSAGTKTGSTPTDPSTASTAPGGVNVGVGAATQNNTGGINVGVGTNAASSNSGGINAGIGSGAATGNPAGINVGAGNMAAAGNTGGLNIGLGSNAATGNSGGVNADVGGNGTGAGSNNSGGVGVGIGGRNGIGASVGSGGIGVSAGGTRVGNVR